MQTEQQIDREEAAQWLERLANYLHSGKISVVKMEQEMPFHRYWSGDQGYHFQISDATITIKYVNENI